MKVSVRSSGANHALAVKMELWLTKEQAADIGPFLAANIGHLELCVKEHFVTGHGATRTVRDTK